jgi:signal transduction histidine kinase
VVRDLVERQDGTAEVDDHAEGGAVFTIRFPSSRVALRNSVV